MLGLDGDEITVDEPAHWWAMLEHARHFRGQVLVAGLGLGLIVHALAANPPVRKITVVERDRDVIEAVWPQRLPAMKAKDAIVVDAGWWERDIAVETPPGSVL